MGDMADYNLESEDPFDPLGTYWERYEPIEEDGYPFSDYYRRSRQPRRTIFQPLSDPTDNEDY